MSTPQMRDKATTLSSSTDITRLEKMEYGDSLTNNYRTASQPEMLASWLPFLDQLYALYYSYWPLDCAKCQAQSQHFNWVGGKTEIDRGLQKSDHSLFHPAITKQRNERTDVAVHFRRRSWDFMPPDTIRPLAESTIGDIVVLAQRLGMNWRTLNLDEGFMQADGNGFSISSTEVKGLGIVFKFSKSGSTGPFPRIVPNIAADKLLCGVLPGHPTLVRRNFDMIRQDRSVILNHDQDGLFSKIGLARIISLGIASNPLVHFQNEAIMLVMPFLPSGGSTITSIVINGMLEGRRAIFSFWEGRFALMQALKYRIDHHKTHKRHADLVKIFQHFQALEEFHEDFYIQFDKAAITGHQKSSSGAFMRDETGQTKLAFIDICRTKFEETDNYFQEHGLTTKFEGFTL